MVKERSKQLGRKMSLESTIGSSKNNINMQIDHFIDLMKKYAKSVLKYKKDLNKIDSTIETLKNAKMQMQKLHTYFKNAPLKIFKIEEY